MHIVKILESIIQDLKDKNIILHPNKKIKRDVLIDYIKDLPYILWVIDFHQMFPANINSEAKKYYGYTDQDLKMLGFELYKDLVHPEHFTDVHSTMTFFNEDPNGVFLKPYKVKVHDHTWRWTYSVSKALDFSDNGEPNLILSLVFDIDSLLEQAYFNKHQPISLQFKESNTELYNKLTHREIEILKLIGEGMSSKEIAKQTNISQKTVETHRGNIRFKLNATNSAELVKFALIFHPEII